MPRDLPLWTGRGTSCPKCGMTVDATWHKKGLVSCHPCDNTIEAGEHMCRRCPECGYGWMEAPADATEDTLGLRSLPGGAGR